MNIVHIVSYYPPHLGGMEYYVQGLAKRLSALGDHVTVLTSSQGKAQAGSVREGLLDVHYLRSIELAHTPIIPALFISLLRQPHDSIFHVHVAQAFTPEMTMLVALRRKIPYVAHIHLDVDPSGFFGFLLEPYKKLVLRYVLRHANKVICSFEENKQEMIAKYGLEPAKIVIIPNAVEETFFVENNASSNNIHLLYVGRLASQKRVGFLLQMLPHIKHAVVLDIVGDGEDRIKLENYCQVNGIQNVVFHGRLSGTALLDQYKSATIAVTSSRKETQSLSLLEAMAAGLPIVATEGPGVTELVQGVGIVTPVNEVEFAKAVDTLLDEPETMQAVAKREKLAAQDHTWTCLVNLTQETYKNL